MTKPLRLGFASYVVVRGYGLGVPLGEQTKPEIGKYTRNGNRSRRLGPGYIATHMKRDRPSGRARHPDRTGVADTGENVPGRIRTWNNDPDLVAIDVLNDPLSDPRCTARLHHVQSDSGAPGGTKHTHAK